MTKKEAAPYGGLEYSKSLRAEFGPNSEHVDMALYYRDEAPIIGYENNSVEYVHFKAEVDPEAEATTPPVFYVPGFTEGVVAKAPLGISLTEGGRSVIMPEQNRKGILRDRDGKKNATYTQAMQALSIIEQEGLTDETVDFVTHSYGSVVLEEMVNEAEHRGWTCFEDSKVAMLAPAGLRHEKLPSYAKRFLHDISSTGSSEKDIEDHAFKYGVKNFLRNIPRTIREVLEMRRTKIDVAQMKKLGGIASVHVLSHAEDKIFSSSVDAETDYRDAVVGSSIEGYITDESIDGWSAPVDFDAVAEGRMSYGGEHAEHNDEQFFPRRSARAILQLLKD